MNHFWDQAPPCGVLALGSCLFFHRKAARQSLAWDMDAQKM